MRKFEHLTEYNFAGITLWVYSVGGFNMRFWNRFQFYRKPKRRWLFSERNGYAKGLKLFGFFFRVSKLKK